jgi:hypothetical protein
MGNLISRLDLNMNPVLKFLDCESNQLTNLDISNNTALEYLGISNLPMLREVCVWEYPFPQGNTNLNMENSDQVYFTAECIYNQHVFIPDTAFLYALINHGVDTDGDSLISYAEANSVYNLEIPGLGIYDLTGIEAFGKLIYLNCASNHLHELNLALNDSLSYLDLGNNQLEELNLEFNRRLTYLDCSGNPITHISLFPLADLKWLGLAQMPALQQVCIWAMPEPFSLMEIDTTGSNIMYFTDLCESDGDYMEENDGIIDPEELEDRWMESATIRGNHLYDSLFVSTGDEDWYDFSLDEYLSHEQTITISCLFDHDRGDINLELYSNQNWGWEDPVEEPPLILASADSQTDAEILEEHLGPGDYLMRVYLESGQQNFYSLTTHIPEGPSLVSDPDIVSFNQVPVYTTSVKTINLINQRAFPIQIDSVSTSLVGSKLAPSSATLRGYGQMDLKVSLLPRSMNEIEGQLRLYYTDTTQKELTIPVTGKGGPESTFIILKEIIDTTHTGNTLIHGLRFHNNNTTLPAHLYTSVQTYFLSKIPHDLTLQKEAVSASWVTTNLPDTSVLAAGQSITFQVKLNTSGLSPGDYYADLIMEWSNPMRYKGFIPISLHVEDDDQTQELAPEQDLLLVYPNPTSGRLTIENVDPQSSTIIISSLNGQLLLMEEIQGNAYQLDLSTFQKGVYFITIRSKDFVSTRKIIKL